MSNTEPSYTIFCFIPGTKSTFPVDVGKTKIVGHLKKAIKTENANALAKIDAEELTLHRVAIYANLNWKENIDELGQSNLNDNNQLDERKQVSYYFDEAPPEGKQYYVIAVTPESTIFPPLPVDILSTRDATVASLYDRMELYRVVLVRGTPASGKTTLARLLERHIRRTTSQAPLFMSTWPKDGTHWWVRLRDAGWERRGSGARFLIIDEGQASYWDDVFYVEFIKNIQHTSPFRVVLFVGYWSASNEVPLEGGVLHNTTLPVIPPWQCISLRRNDDDDPTPVGLLLGRDEYEEMYRKFYPPILFGDDLRLSIYDNTDGHAGAIFDLFILITRHPSYCEGTRSRGTYSLDDFEQHINQWKLIDDLWGAQNLSRGLPKREDLQDPTVARLFRTLLVEKQVQKDDFMDEEDQACLVTLYRRGWVDMVKGPAGEPCYIFATGLHQRVIDCLLGLHTVRPSIEETSLFDFTVAVLRYFSYRQLAMPRQVGDGVQNPPEAQYQDEFYRCAHLHSAGSLVMFPAFGSAKGRVDFFVNSKRWAIELLRNGDRIEEHLARFAAEGEYRKMLGATDYIILDFRMTVPSDLWDDPNLYHVVFENDQYRTLQIFSNKCHHLTSIELLN